MGRTKRGPAKPVRTKPVRTKPARTQPGRTKRVLTRHSPPEERAPAIIRRLRRAYPDAEVALHFSTPLETLVATILSAQTTDQGVNQVTRTLFQKYRSPQDYLRVPEAELAADIKPTGFFNQKAKAVRGASLRIVEEYRGEVPRTMAELVTLPGVARKTANIVQGNAYPDEHRKDPDAGIAVDTHVRRVAQRLGFTSEKDPDRIEQDLMRLVNRKE